MKKTKRKLALDKQTLSQLTPGHLTGVAGGNAPDGNGPCSTVDACVRTWTNPCTAYTCETLVSCGRVGCW